MRQWESVKSNFAWFCVNAGSEKHLIEEVKIIFPSWRLAYSRSGMVTFKMLEALTFLQTFSKTPFFSFARRWGINLFHGNFDLVAQFLKDNGPFFQVHIWEQELLGFQDEKIESLVEILAHAGSQKINQPAERGPLIQVMRIDREEFWINLQMIGANHILGISGGQNGLNTQEFSQWISPPISRAYYKMQNSWSIINPQERLGHWLELGCAPGGAVQFLLEQGNKVTGVDPGKMDERLASYIGQNCVEKNPPKFHFIESSTQDVSKKMIFETFGNVDWLAVDMNLSIKQSLSFSERIIADFPSIKGIIYTFKISHPNMIRDISLLQKRLFWFGFSYQQSFQWPSHRKEFLQVALRKKNFTTILPKDLSNV